MIVVVGEPEAEDTRLMLAALRRPFAPQRVVLFVPHGEEASPLARVAPALANLRMIQGKATAYVCRDGSCAAPTTDVKAALSLVG
jgi:uncharacterized protein